MKPLWFICRLYRRLSVYCSLTFRLFVGLLFVCNFFFVCLPVFLLLFQAAISLCLSLWAAFWQGLLSLSLAQASKRERDKPCHIMRGLHYWLWLRVVIQNRCREEPKLARCQRRMFTAGRQESSSDNVGYAQWLETTASYLDTLRDISLGGFTVVLTTPIVGNLPVMRALNIGFSAVDNPDNLFIFS